MSVCVCPSLHSHTTARTPDRIKLHGGMVGVPSRCALLDRFAIGARVSLLRQHSAEREMSARACGHSMPGNVFVPAPQPDDGDVLPTILLLHPS